MQLTAEFFEDVTEHPVPLDLGALRALGGSPLRLDVYCWLTYRLHVLRSPKPITWKALQSQFGNGYRGLHHFKPRFLENLHLACAVYPSADVEVDERGLTLKPSRPPVAPRLVR